MSFTAFTSGFPGSLLLRLGGAMQLWFRAVAEAAFLTNCLGLEERKEKIEGKKNAEAK